ncbi:MAG: class I SAM-dependent methyltransferase [Candidatus Aenigmatarchaeota archaeon]
MKDKEYFEYLRNRSWLSFQFRKCFYKSIIKEFKGKVLDVGCGLGEFMESYPSSVGIDMNPYCVKYCKERGLDAKAGNAQRIPFKNSSFDGVFCLCVLEHLKKPELAVKEMHRVLKKNGKLVIIVPTESGFRHDKTHVTFLQKENTKEILKRSGFKIKKMSYFPFSFKFFRERLFFNELRVVATK